MYKKILTILIVVLVLGLAFLIVNKVIKLNKNIPVTQAECFEFNTEKGEITGYRDLCGTEVNIPKEINGVQVKEIGNYAFSKKGLTAVIIPDNVEVIGIGAFSENEIETLELPNSLKSIKPLAFEKNKIKKLNIPETVTNIGFKAFNDNQVSGEEAFIYQRTKEGIDNTVLVGYAGKERDNVKIPKQVEHLYLYVFSDCGIKNIEINEKLERIETGAFENNNLISIEIPKSVMIINQGAFTGNEELKEIKIKGKSKIEDFGLFNTYELDTTIINFEGSVEEA